MRLDSKALGVLSVPQAASDCFELLLRLLLLLDGMCSHSHLMSHLGEYNVHPMWYDVRQATKKMEHGVYEDLSGQPAAATKCSKADKLLQFQNGRCLQGQAFRTAIISCHGLQSRVKVPARSAVELRRVGDLKSIDQVAEPRQDGSNFLL